MPSYRAKLSSVRAALASTASVFSTPARPRPRYFLLAGSLSLLSLVGLAGSAMAQLEPLPPMEGEASPDDASPAGTPASDALESPPPPTARDGNGLLTGTEPSVELLPDVPPETLYPEVPGVFAAPIEPVFDEYRLGPGDAVFVSVQRFPDLSFQATLDFAGNVIVPIEGALSLEGQTLEEATNTLRQVYNKYVVIREVQPGYTRASAPPDVTLALTAQRGVEVTILGEVERPGFYPLPQARVSTALLLAGGATTTADLRNLTIQRRIGNSIVEETVDLFTPLKQGGALPDLRLENGDVLIVNQLDPSDLENYDRNLVARSTLAQPEITIRFINYSASTGGRRGERGSALGALNIANGSSFIDAVTQLGVSPDQANLGSVGLIRFDPETGEAVALSLDAQAAFMGDPTQNPQLQDNDVVIVGRNLLTRITYVLNTVTQPFQDVLSFLLFFDGIFDTDFFD